MNQDEDPAQTAELYRRMAKLAYDLADDCEDLDLLRAYTQVAGACLRLAGAPAASPFRKPPPS